MCSLIGGSVGLTSLTFQRTPATTPRHIEPYWFPRLDADIQVVLAAEEAHFNKFLRLLQKPVAPLPIGRTSRKDDFDDGDTSETEDDDVDDDDDDDDDMEDDGDDDMVAVTPADADVSAGSIDGATRRSPWDYSGIRRTSRVPSHRSDDSIDQSGDVSMDMSDEDYSL